MTYLCLDHVISKLPTSHCGSPDATAVIAGDGEYSYADVSRRATMLALELQRLGVRPGDRIVVLLHNRIEWFDVFFAAAKIRAVVVPGNHFLVSDELRHIIRDSGASVVISQAEFLQRLAFVADEPAVRLALSVDEPQQGWARIDIGELDAGDDVEVTADVAPSEPFLIQYTSGTTGVPKGVVHTQNTILLNTLQQVADFGLGPSDVMVQNVAFGWVAGLHGFTLATLMAGGQVVLRPTSGVDAVGVCRDIVQQRATLVTMAPLVLKRIVDIDGLESGDVSALRLIITGGDAVGTDLLERLSRRVPGCEVVQFYGMTEFPSSGTYLRPDGGRTKFGSVGKGGVLTQLRVVDSALVDRPSGEVGEIVIRSACSAVGYWNQPEATAQAFIDGWFRTGDLGYVDSDGDVFIVGRSKDMVITGGLNVYPAEVERILERHPAIREVAVVGIPDETWGEITAAVAVVSETVSQDTLHDFAARHLAKYKVPRRWIVTSQALPRTAAGKVKKHVLRRDPRW